MLAGTDRLDRPLTIGQMQGRFQMIVLPQVYTMLSWPVMSAGVDSRRASLSQIIISQ